MSDLYGDDRDLGGENPEDLDWDTPTPDPEWPVAA